MTRENGLILSIIDCTNLFSGGETGDSDADTDTDTDTDADSDSDTTVVTAKKVILKDDMTGEYLVPFTDTKEINEQINGLLESLNTKVDLDGSNAQFPHVTETYKNGTSWYRVWSDGWCEQGGVVSIAAFTTTATANVTLLKPYIDTNYSVIEQFKSGGTNWAMVQGGGAIPNSTNSIKITLYQTYSTGASIAAVTRTWETKGYIS